jgi:hypothetical protein
MKTLKMCTWLAGKMFLPENRKVCPVSQTDVGPQLVAEF